jgi:FkbM family methyltransferase
MPVLESPVASDRLSAQLDALLGESVDAAIRREQTAFDQCAAPFEQKLVLFGAGAFGRHTLAGLRRIGLEPLAFTDNNARLWGQQVDGVPVFSPADAAKRFGAGAAFIVTIWNGALENRLSNHVSQLTALGCQRAVPAALLFWKYPEVFLPHYPLDLPHKLLQQTDEVRTVFDLWADERSRREYVAQVAFRLLLDFDGLESPDPRHYFPTDLFRLSPDEVLVDCGAFDGDTIRSLVSLQGNRFGRIIAYEPDPLNWAQLQETLARLPKTVAGKITCWPQAVGSQTGTVYFNATGTDLSTVGAGTLSVDCVRLDESLKNESPTLAKFDIEGFELEALAGAQETIRRHSPILAVSAYHQQSHLWEIPSAIRDISDGYRYSLRPHGSEGWDLVCYAIPPCRLNAVQARSV